MLAALQAIFRKRTTIPRSSEDGRSHIPGVPDELTIEVDADGSPVTMRAEEWFVCFVPGLQKQWWHRFTDPRHKHVFALRMVNKDQWILFEPWWTRIMNTTLNLDEAVKFLRWGGVGSVLRVTESIPGSGSQTRGWANCAVLVSLLLGRSYWTWTPHGLYRALSREPGVELIDVGDFLEGLLTDVAHEQAVSAVGDWGAHPDKPMQEVLHTVGARLVRTITSPIGLGMYRIAVSEAFRFPAASTAFFERGPNRVIEELAAMFKLYQGRGELSSEQTPEKLARNFLLMLRGNLHLEIIFGCRTSPEEAEIERRVSSVVDLFLRGLHGCNAGDEPTPGTTAASTGVTLLPFIRRDRR